jgi:hypothetical protein
MPGLTLADHEIDVSGSPDRSRVFLPSDLDSVRRGECCSSKLIAAEISLRTAAANEALEDVRRHIRMRSALYNFLPLNMVGYNDATRSAAALSTLRGLIDTSANTYRAHHTALLKLKLTGPWEKKLRVLKDTDLTGLNTKSKTVAGAEAIARVASHAPPTGTQGDEATSVSGEPDGNVAVEVGADPAHARLVGALNHDQQRRGVSWIWLGVNLKASEDNGDPAGEVPTCVLCSRGQADSTCSSLHQMGTSTCTCCSLGGRAGALMRGDAPVAALLSIPGVSLVKARGSLRWTWSR